MGHFRLARVALCIALLGVISAANAQTPDDRWRQDLKPLVPPVVPLPPNSQLNPGSVAARIIPTPPRRCRPRQRRRRPNRRRACA